MGDQHEIALDETEEQQTGQAGSRAGSRPGTGLAEPSSRYRAAVFLVVCDLSMNEL
jgi:hypothetical protein